MSAITQTFNWFKDLASNILEFFTNFVSSLFAIIKNLPKIIEFLTGAITALPSPLVVFATATIAITVAYFIVGRQEGGNS